jgi:hypothetical protein
MLMAKGCGLMVQGRGNRGQTRGGVVYTSSKMPPPRTAQDYYALDNAFALIEGQPQRKGGPAGPSTPYWLDLTPWSSCTPSSYLVAGMRTFPF